MSKENYTIREMTFSELCLILSRWQITLEEGADFEKDVEKFVNGENWRRKLSKDDKDTYTKQEVIDFILQERNRCREICDGHSSWFERRIKEFAPSLRKIYEEGLDACRRIRNDVSDACVLDIDPKSDEEKIKEKYKL